MGHEARVLVVEDDPDLLFLVADVLAGEGFHVRTARDGLAALADITDHGMPDLILLDIRMPRMDGLEFARELSRSHPVPAPLIVMTAAADPRPCATQVKAKAWLAKPFNIEDMITTVRRVLDSARDAAQPGA